MVISKKENWYHHENKKSDHTNDKLFYEVVNISVKFHGKRLFIIDKSQAVTKQLRCQFNNQDNRFLAWY